MKGSGNAISLAPADPASAMSPRALSTVASRSRNTGAACTAATVAVFIELSLTSNPSSRMSGRFPLGSMVLEERVERRPGGELLPGPLLQDRCPTRSDDGPAGAVTNDRGALVDGKHARVLGDRGQDHRSQP